MKKEQAHGVAAGCAAGGGEAPVRRAYEAPATRRAGVETEGGFCGSGEQVDVSATQQTIEVKEYETIDNKVTFD